MQTRIRGVFFDMDGVLVNVSGSYRRAIQETVEHFAGRAIPASTIQRYKNGGGYNDDWKLTHRIISDAGITVSMRRVVDEFQRRYRGENGDDGLIAQEPALISTETLDALCRPDRLMAIITGRPGADAQWTIERFGWQRYFPLLIPREKQERRTKPDPYPLQRALAVFAAAGRRLRPEEVVYIGDTVDDMVAARAAGMWAIGMVPPYLGRVEHEALLYERGAHHVIHDTSALPRLIEHFSAYVQAEPVAS
ncbi:MAG: TIGR01548 family HAD-type hydrolase [Bacteroidota bacterium]